MPPAPRPELRQLPEAVHGAADPGELEALGLSEARVLDFSVNGNAYGPSPRVRAVLARSLAAAVDRYPDRRALALRRAVAGALGVDVRQVVAGNGSGELLWAVALAFLRPGDRVAVLGPTFAEYGRAAALMGASVEAWNARPEDGFRVPADAVGTWLARLRPRLVVVCNPNNPTGVLLPLEAVAAWASALPETLVVVDEAYLDFVPEAPSAVHLGLDNVVVLRSLTKAHGLAGLRLGYAVAHPDVAEVLMRVLPPWNVNALAQAAGVAALADPGHVRRTVGRLREARDRLAAALRSLGFEVWVGTAHFLLVRVGDAAGVRQALLRRGILVRDCTSFGLPQFIRVAARRPEENRRLVRALAALTGCGKPWQGIRAGLAGPSAN